ncbi:MAG: UDP-phosphate galactose phosphotransferase [Pseudonocardiaceae bacterium]|nr:UDP-phosphate galactose phosphotransferase [Pseudonocardiaceae bacterium]
MTTETLRSAPVGVVSSAPPAQLARPSPLPAIDVLALAVAVGIAGFGWLSAGYALAVLTVLAWQGMYRVRITPRVADEVPRLLVAVAIPLPLASSGTALLAAGLLITLRGVGYRALCAARASGRLVEPALLVGDVAELAKLVREHPELGLVPREFPDGMPPAELAELVARHGIRRVLVRSAEPRDELVSALRTVRELGVDVCMVPSLPELGLAVPRASLDEVWGIPLIPLRGRRLAGPVKRAFDVVLGTVLLIVFGPLLLVLAVAVRLRNGRPALFRQLRVTGAGRQASIIKLRTLDEHPDPDTRWDVPIRLSTPLGRWLRATHLDELPRLLNVVRGQLSLVGPRPERPHFVARFSADIPQYRDRHRMPAGITGWAQVHGLHGDSSLADRARFDNQYIEYWSPWLDLVILARTVRALASRRGGAR